MGWPAAVGVPPVHEMTTWPTYSATPSPRTAGATPAFIVQTSGAWAAARPEKRTKLVNNLQE